MELRTVWGSTLPSILNDDSTHIHMALFFCGRRLYGSLPFPVIDTSQKGL